MTVTDALPPIFVINLKRSADRRKDMSGRLDPLKMHYSFFEAVDGQALDLKTLPSYAGLRRRLFFGRDLSPGEMGCLLSHRAIYQHMVDNNLDKAIVLEDDVFLSPDFPEVVGELLNLPLQWDMIRFLDREKVYRYSRPIRVLARKPYVLNRVLLTAGGAYGYMLTQKAARTFLQHMYKNVLPVDILHGYVWRTGLEVFAVGPSPVAPDNIIGSTIGDGRFEKTLHIAGWEKMVYPLTRSWHKFSELVGKRRAYWLSWPRDILLKRQQRRVP
ncbi:MAG: glycosyltransferase family 25 protein [Proteobacteria bacterium]|nr:glycosyltransferase family 25 protein [Pseudomonadota bacterium]